MRLFLFAMEARQSQNVTIYRYYTVLQWKPFWSKPKCHCLERQANKDVFMYVYVRIKEFCDLKSKMQCSCVSFVVPSSSQRPLGLNSYFLCKLLQCYCGGLNFQVISHRFGCACDTRTWCKCFTLNNLYSLEHKIHMTS